MAKYIMDCPRCKKPLQVSTGLFAKKKVACPHCKREIVPSLEKVAEEICAHCGSRVVYDRTKPNSAICPTCHTKLRSGKQEQITCPSCLMPMDVDKSAKTCTCPQCKSVFDVQSRLAQKESSKTAQVIHWEGEKDVFIYRHPVENFKLGSQLIVKEGQKAIFFRNGQALDIFGPGRYTLETQNLPLIEEALKYPTDADLTFSSQIYFVKTEGFVNVNWAIPYTPLRNPGMNFYVQVGACGSAKMKIKEGNENIKKFLIQVIGSTFGGTGREGIVAQEKYDNAYLEKELRDYITTHLGSLFADIIVSSNISILDLAPKRVQIGDMLIKEYNELLENYGLEIPPKMFLVTDIQMQPSAELEEWKRQEADRVLRVREETILKETEEARRSRVLAEEQTAVQRDILRAQGNVEIQKLSAQGAAEATLISSQANAQATKLAGQASAEVYKAQAAAEAEGMRTKGYTYAQETSRQIALEAMQNGLPGTGGGNGGGGLASDMVGLGVGLSAMGGVVNLTKDIVSPIIGQISDSNKQLTDAPAPQTNLVGAWNCSCGKACITSRFCPDCGSPKPADSGAWNCACGQSGITSNFCPNCGSKKG